MTKLVKRLQAVSFECFNSPTMLLNPLPSILLVENNLMKMKIKFIEQLGLKVNQYGYGVKEEQMVMMIVNFMEKTE